MPREKRSSPGGNRASNGRGTIVSDDLSHYTPCAGKTQAPNFAAWALRYALAGWQVLPLLPGTKEPATPNGWHDASDDPEQIAEWWARWPGANIGLALSPIDGRYARVAFDVDPRHGGNLEHVYRLGLDPARTVTQRTRGDGWHVIYDRPAGIDLRSKIADAPGLDVLTHGYIVAAPSVVEGKAYRWERDPLDVDIARLPLEIAERLAKRTNGADPAHRAAARPTTTGKAVDDAPPLHVLAHALEHLGPWTGDYHWWLECLMGLHNAYPGSDGLDLAERWGDGKPGEIAEKWASFDAARGVTWRTLVHHAKAAGWRPELATEEQPTRETAHDVLHTHLAEHGGDCPLCGKSFFERRVDGDVVHGRRRVMMCHRRDCGTWQVYKAIRQVEQAEPWAWPAWFVSEHDAGEWARLIDGPLATRADWLAAPLISGKIALFAGWSVRRTAVSVSLRTMLEMAGERILAIPTGKRLRRPKAAARAKREQGEPCVRCAGRVSGGAATGEGAEAAPAGGDRAG